MAPRRRATGAVAALGPHAVRPPSAQTVAASVRLRVMARVPVGRLITGLYRARGDTLPDGVPSVAGRALPRRAGRPPYGLPPTAIQVTVLTSALPSLARGQQVRRVRQVRRPSFGSQAATEPETRTSGSLASPYFGGARKRGEGKEGWKRTTSSSLPATIKISSALLASGTRHRLGHFRTATHGYCRLGFISGNPARTSDHSASRSHSIPEKAATWVLGYTSAYLRLFAPLNSKRSPAIGRRWSSYFWWVRTYTTTRRWRRHHPSAGITYATPRYISNSTLIGPYPSMYHFTHEDAFSVPPLAHY